jgi:LytS/YehU family sensor histidine kinase
MLEVHRRGNQMRITVMNSGIGIDPTPDRDANGHGVGLRNIKSRLKLHYGEDSRFEIAQVDPRHVAVDVEIPLQYSPDFLKPIARFGTQ